MVQQDNLYKFEKCEYLLTSIKGLRVNESRMHTKIKVFKQLKKPTVLEMSLLIWRVPVFSIIDLNILESLTETVKGIVLKPFVPEKS